MKQTMELLQKISEKRDEVLRLKEAGDISGTLKAADELNKLKAEYDVEKSIEASIFTVGKPVEKITSIGDVNMLRRAFNKKNLERTGVNVGSMTDTEMELSKKFNNVSNIRARTLLKIRIVKRKPNSSVAGVMYYSASITSNMYTMAILELERLYRCSLNKRKSPSCLLGEAFCGVCRAVFTWLLYHILDFLVIH